MFTMSRKKGGQRACKKFINSEGDGLIVEELCMVVFLMKEDGVAMFPCIGDGALEITLVEK